MSDAVTIAAMGSIATCVVALIGLVVSIVNVWKTNRVKQATVEIHTIVNSNLSRISTALDVANEKIAGMEKLIAAGVESKNEARIKAENAAQELLTSAVIAASQKVNETSNQPNGA